MTGLNRKQIVERAFVRGESMTYAHFLKSKAVAERVAVDVLRHLRANGVNVEWHGSRRLVVVRPGAQWPGTFTVEVRLPGAREYTPEYYPGNPHEVASNKAFAAIKASVKPDDLVTSWTRPRY